MSLTRLVRLGTTPLVALAVLIGFCVAGTGPASADTTYGHPGPSYSGVTHPPTSDKPQSKLWWNDGSWWGYLWTSGSGWHIWRLDRSSETWVDTGTLVDPRSTTLADVLWDGSHLYIASDVSTVSTDSNPVLSQSGQPAKLYRYSYSSGSYTLDPGFPSQINNNSSESLTIDEDSTGTIWATWTQVSSSTTNTVYVNDLPAGSVTWNTPFVVPNASNPHPSVDDISSVVAFQHSKIGVMWTDQNTGTVWWAWRNDGTDPTAAASWHVGPAVNGKGMADDHLNLKSLQSDASGRVYAAVKTSLNDTSSDPSLAQLLLLVYKPGTGSFSSSTISTTGDCVTRPQVLLDGQHSIVHVFQTAPSTSVSGCPYSGIPGAIYEKTASMDNPVFSGGRGTPVIQDGSSANVNDVTTTKQDVNATTGIVVLASNNVTGRYWFADESLGGTAAAPTASFTSAPTSGTAPLTVSFTDTSTGSPTAWSWTFGDGGTAATQNPSHTYTAAGSYTATLRASNAGGTSAPASATITVNAPSSSGGVTAGASTTAVNSTGATAVTVPAPTGIANGDLLIAQITADLAPSITGPSGWSTVISPLSIGSGARVFVYYHVVSTASSEPSSYTWQLSSAVKWNVSLADFHGVNTTSPFDTAATTAVDSSYSASSLTVVGVTTDVSGALVVGGIGADTKNAGVTAPTGWTQAADGNGGQESELAYRPMPSAGATGSATWKYASVYGSAGWMRALRPA